LIAAFLARAPLYLSVFPPFEGWDEYQHLGYIAYLDQTGAIPVFSTAIRVPLSILPLVIAMPHSRWGATRYGSGARCPTLIIGMRRRRPSLRRQDRFPHPDCIKRSIRRLHTHWQYPSGIR
jgi:hypothetical protein